MYTEKEKIEEKKKEKKRKENKRREKERKEKIRVRNIISHTSALFRKFILSLFLDSCLILVP